MIRNRFSKILTQMFSIIFAFFILANTVFADDSHIYMGSIINRNKIFLSIDNGSTTIRIPEAYNIISPSSYNPLSRLILLSKSNSLYVFNCDSSKINPILTNFKPNNSEIEIIQSVSDDNSFLISTYSISEDSIYSEKHYNDYYFLNAIYKRYSKVPEFLNAILKDNTNQIVYDSANSSIIKWLAGEGRYMPLPIEIIDLKTGLSSELIRETDFPVDPLFNINYYNNFLIGTPKNISITNQVFVYSIRSSLLKKYTLSNIEHFDYAYSSIYDDSSDSLLIGQKDSILRLKLQTAKISDVLIHSDNKVYLNKMYLISNRLVYQSNNKIVILDPNNLSIINTYTLMGIDKSKPNTEFGIFNLSD